MAAAPKKKSRKDYELELQRLKAMYGALPPEKKAIHRPHMQARIDTIIKAIKKSDKFGRRGHRLLEAIVLVLLVCAIALAIGFFGVTYLVQNT